VGVSEEGLCPSSEDINRLMIMMTSSDFARYMDTVLVPFLDTYLRNIQSSYQQMTSKILKRIKMEINNAVQKKNNIYKELMDLADKLKIPCEYSTYFICLFIYCRRFTHYSVA
jgi:predicted S18 family serine protease